MLRKSHEVKEENCELLLIFYFLTQGGVYDLFTKQYNSLFYYVYQTLLNMIKVNIFFPLLFLFSLITDTSQLSKCVITFRVFNKCFTYNFERLSQHEIFTVPLESTETNFFR